MMQDRLSPALERVLEAARVDSQKLGSSDTTFLSLWKALLEEEEAHPAQLFEQIGLDRNQYLQFAQLPEQEFRLSEILRLAEEQAFRHGADATITAEFVFLALLQEFEAFLRQKLFSPLQFKQLQQILNPEKSTVVVMETSLQFTDPLRDSGTARLLDVNLNRARESFRILDDYARFCLNDAFLCQELKSLRHRLAAAVEFLPAEVLLYHRDTEADVGTRLTAAGEFQRNDPAQVAAINLKRLQEALRSLEEFGKILSVPFAQEIEQIRYRSYTLEKWLVRGSAVRQRLQNCQLYLLATRQQATASLEWTIQEAVAGGVSIVQLREKNLPDRELIETAKKLCTWTRKAGALFIVNDRVDIARLVEADGVHLGQEDLPIWEARRILGPNFFIGVSTHNVGQLERAIAEGADYLGVGPTFPSKTKSFVDFPGLSFVEQACQRTSLPTFAIGGIDPTNVDQVVQKGLRRIAVSAALLQAEDPRQISAQLLLQLNPVQ